MACCTDGAEPLVYSLWIGDERRAHKLLLEKPEGKRPLGRPKIRWEDNITWDLKEVDYESDWKVLAQDRICMLMSWRH